MDLHKQFAVDPQTEVDGVWFRLDDVSEIKVARWNNPNYRKALAVLTAPYKARGNITQEQSEECIVHAMASTILVDWRGDLSVNGEPLGEYSAEKSLQLLTDPFLKDFRELVTTLSNDMESFRVSRLQEDVGKSSSSSAGPDSGETK